MHRVATFDVLSSTPASDSADKEPYILLQPRPNLEDVDDAGILKKKVNGALGHTTGPAGPDEGVG